MGRKCFVPYCTSGYKSNKKGSVRLFKAPSDADLLEKWRKAIPCSDKILTKKDYICAKHFKSSDIISKWKATSGNYVVQEVNIRPRLAPRAVPEIFVDCLPSKTNSCTNIRPRLAPKIFVDRPLSKSSSCTVQPEIVKLVLPEKNSESTLPSVSNTISENALSSVTNTISENALLSVANKVSENDLPSVTNRTCENRASSITKTFVNILPKINSLNMLPSVINGNYVITLQTFTQKNSENILPTVINPNSENALPSITNKSFVNILPKVNSENTISSSRDGNYVSSQHSLSQKKYGNTLLTVIKPNSENAQMSVTNNTFVNMLPKQNFGNTVSSAINENNVGTLQSLTMKYSENTPSTVTKSNYINTLPSVTVKNVSNISNFSFQDIISMLPSISMPAISWGSHVNGQSIIFCDVNILYSAKCVIKRTVMIDANLSWKLFINNCLINNSLTNISELEKPPNCCSDIESVLKCVQNLNICHGGPQAEDIFDVYTESGFIDTTNTWRHKNCPQVLRKGISKCAHCRLLTRRLLLQMKCGKNMPPKRIRNSSWEFRYSQLQEAKQKCAKALRVCQQRKKFLQGQVKSLKLQLHKAQIHTFPN